MKYLSNVPLDRAINEYMDTLKQNGMLPKAESIYTVQSADRVTAAPVYAQICAPHYNACAMDGIAVKAKLTFGASETAPIVLAENQFHRVNTGDPLPPDCDAVVMIEDVIIDSDGAGVKLCAAAAPWQHVRQIGEDICAGEMLLPSYSLISPSALGAMMASGVTEVSVVKRPIVGIVPTAVEAVTPGVETLPTDGEAVMPKPDPTEGVMPEFNAAIFSAMLNQWGAETVIFPIEKDDPKFIKSALETALEQCDIVIINSASSAGGEDYAVETISDVGEILHHGIAIKPGKSAILGYRGEKPILAAPGYPVSGIIVIDQILRPMVEYLCGKIAEQIEYTDAILSKTVVSTPKYKEFVRVRLGYVEGKIIASPLGRGSGVVTSYMKAAGIVEVPQDSEGYESGTPVKVRLLRPISEIKRDIVAIGSHDPLLDELSDMLRVTYRDVSLVSDHVGSMGGIMAIRRGEAHIAGIHLLNEKTGEYNKSFVEKYFQNGGVRLIKGVKRSQGLILQTGNPKSIKSITDLTKNNLRYANRQKGSGTRILIDYLCRKEGVDTSKIHGYDREEYTHTSVAALIAADSADAGLGVYSAAKLYGLDFLPICDEEYDFLIPDYAWDMPQMQKLLEILSSEKFRNRAAAIGGYRIDWCTTPMLY